MKIGIIVLCRFNSTRLPGKILREIRGRAVLGHILDRIHRAAPDFPVVVATSSEVSDDPIARYCRRSAVDCYRGDLNNVAGRFLCCAERYDWDYAVRINGDNLFVDPDLLRNMIELAVSGDYDFVTNVPERTFPYGMSVEILKVDFYRDAASRFSKPDDYEHVTLWLYDHEDVGRRLVYRNTSCPEAKGLKLALDTEEDFQRSDAIIRILGCSVAGMDKVVEAYRHYQNS